MKDRDWRALVANIKIRSKRILLSTCTQSISPNWMETKIKVNY